MRPAGGDAFDLSGGHPALDLVNSLDERLSGSPIERLARIESVHALAAAARLDGPPGMPAVSARSARKAMPARGDDKVLARIRALRESGFRALSAVAEGRSIPRDDLALIETAVRDAREALALHQEPGEPIARWRWRPISEAERLLHGFALSIESLVTGAACSKVRICAAADCAVLFVDTSRTGRRRWCSMATCGNRAKQRALRRSRRPSRVSRGARGEA